MKGQSRKILAIIGLMMVCAVAILGASHVFLANRVTYKYNQFANYLIVGGGLGYNLKQREVEATELVKKIKNKDDDRKDFVAHAKELADDFRAKYENSRRRITKNDDLDYFKQAVVGVLTPVAVEYDEEGNVIEAEEPGTEGDYELSEEYEAGDGENARTEEYDASELVEKLLNNIELLNIYLETERPSGEGFYGNFLANGGTATGFVQKYSTIEQNPELLINDDYILEYLKKMSIVSQFSIKIASLEMRQTIREINQKIASIDANCVIRKNLGENNCTVELQIGKTADLDETLNEMARSMIEDCYKISEIKAYK